MTDHLPPPRLQEQLVDRARTVRSQRDAQEALWQRGFTRRRFLAGAGMVGVAALGSQLVTTRVAYGAPVTSTGNTLIVIFLRGAADGLRLLVPATSALGVDHLRTVRPGLVPGDSALRPLPGAGGWAVHQSFDPLLPLWTSGELAFVPAVSAAGVTRSHFQAQQLLERGGSETAGTGWLDRALQQLGPGTTFRAVAAGQTAPGAMQGDQDKLVMSSLAAFTFPGWTGVAERSITAIDQLYRGLGGPLGEDVPRTLAALATADTVRAGVVAAAPQNGATYPSNNGFAAALRDLAALLHAEVGLEVATVDVGGWDTHTDEATDLDRLSASAASALAAFLQDLGAERRKRVTVAVMTEFGRRVAANGSGGSDHGHGSILWLLGGGLAGAGVYGRWQGLSPETLDDGDVAGLNSAFDVLGELAQKRLGLGSLAAVFPGHGYAPLGLASAT